MHLYFVQKNQNILTNLTSQTTAATVATRLLQPTSLSLLLKRSRSRLRSPSRRVATKRKPIRRKAVRSATSPLTRNAISLPRLASRNPLRTNRSLLKASLSPFRTVRSRHLSTTTMNST